MIFKPILPVIPFGICTALIVALLAFLILRREGDSKKKALIFAQILPVVALVVLIEARPMTREDSTDVEVKNTDVLFVVDSTVSMWAEDGHLGTRMDDVRAACQTIMDDLQGASFGLVSFDNKSRILAPFTQDTVAVEDALTMIYEPEPEYAKGSSLNAPLANIQEMGRYSKKNEGRLTVILFFSDGEITDGKELVSYEPAKEFADYGAVLGVGSAEGGRMKDPDGFYIRDTDGEYGVSVPDQESLKQIAADLGLSFYTLGEDTDATVMTIAETIREKSFISTGQEEMEVYNDTYYIYALLLLAVLAVEAYLALRRLTL